MKRVILSTLFLILIISSVLFYDKYFKKLDESENLVTENLVIDNSAKSLIKSIDKKKSNFIKNLEYEISTIDENKYKITSESSEITYKDGQELILMNKVKAVLNNKTKDIDYLFFISAEKGVYNNFNYYTKFEDNVEIRYEDNLIYADELILDLENNLVLIKDNVKYNGVVGILEADNIKLNLITMKTDIFMNNTNKNILYKSNK
tara:strand:+ start:521 stop:1135 length:615 start_codon:yes stop_codon:yes gene_type:complete